MKRTLLFGLLFIANLCLGQTITVEGYTFQEGNRGYLSDVYLRISDSNTGETLAETKSNIDGFFSCEIKDLESIKVFVDKSRYKMSKLDMDRLQGGEKIFIKVEMNLEPGYSFEVTLAEKKKGPGLPTDAITGALIEVYNNTKREPVMVIKDNVDPDFNVNFQKGNHYTVLIRKPGFLSKRMEAYVDVDGCILCFEGVGNVQPGVADNLTDRNAAGVLLANVELDPIFEGKTLEIENIYYGLGKFNITKKAKEQLKKVILLMEDNPNLTLELGSHTDSRGKNQFNKNLSEKRAKASVSYIVNNSGINRERVVSRGYGEENIINKCKDGVQCTELEHGINRRTELKILGIGELGRYKPLAQMKTEEFFEQDLLNGESKVKVGEGETLEEVLARQKEEKEEKVVSNIIVEEVIETKEEVSILNNTPKEKVAVEETIEEKPKVEETRVEIEKEVVLEGRLDKKLKEVQNTNPDEVKLPEIENTMVEEIIVVEKVEIEEQSIIYENPNAGLDGIKVVIKKASELLQEDSELFKRHDTLEVYIADDNSIWYMMGGFANIKQAEDSLNNFIKSTYPDAFIINLVDGIIK